MNNKEGTQEIEELEDGFVNITSGDEGEIYAMSAPNIGGFTKDLVLKVAELTCAAYSSAELQESNQRHLVDGYSVFPFKDSDSNHAGNIYFKGKQVVVSYRGTWNDSDVISDLDCTFSIPPFLDKIGRAHTGFYNKFRESCPTIKDEILRYCQQREFALQDLDLIISGHSMGGGIASIFALWFKSEFPNSHLRVATFGTPRTFDFPAANHYSQQLGSGTIRVVQHHIDPVATVTPGSFGYKHVGEQLRVGVVSGYYPHQMLGYIKYIQNLPPNAFVTQNSASVFWPISYTLGYLNAGIIGNFQQALRSYFRRENLSNIPYENQL